MYTANTNSCLDIAGTGCVKLLQRIVMRLLRVSIIGIRRSVKSGA